MAPVLYIDANPFVYLVEGNDAVATPIRDLFALLRRAPGTATTSELTLAEVLPKADPRTRRRYLDLIVWNGIFELLPVSRSVLLETVRYRRHLVGRRPGKLKAMPKLPDAIHVVTAIQAKCEYLLSLDRGLKLPTSIRRVEPDKPGIAALMRELS